MNPKLKIYIWLWYPLMVTALILFSYNWVFSGARNRIEESSHNRKQVESQMVLINQMKGNLQKVGQVDKEKKIEQLKKLLEAVPASKRAWILAHEIVRAASEAAGGWQEYNGSVGEVKEATYEAEITKEKREMLLSAKLELVDIEVLRKFVSILYSYLPLARVNSAEWTPSSMTVEIEGAWLPWKKTEFLPDQLLEVTDEDFQKLVIKIGQFERIRIATDAGLEAEKPEPVSPF